MQNELIELGVGEKKLLDNGTNQMIERGLKCPKGMNDFQLELFKKVNYGPKVIFSLLVSKFFFK